MQLRKLLSVLLSLIVLFSLGCITMGCFTPELFTITPTSGVNNQAITLTLTGKHFYSRSTVKLALDGQEDILPTDIKYVSKTHLVCTFDLNGKAPGNWDVIVINKAKKISILKGGLKIEAVPIEETLPAEEDATVEETAVQEVAVTEEDAADESEVDADSEEEIIEEDAADESDEDVLVEDEAEIAAVVEEEETSAADLNDSLSAIFFDYDKSELRPDQISALDSDLEVLSENGELFISLSGHTDERGSNDYNMGLSSRRAEAVKQYLIDKGIDPQRIILFSYGEEHPLKSGHDEEAWQFNRRVDVMVWDTEPSEEDCIRNEE